MYILRFLDFFIALFGILITLPAMTIIFILGIFDTGSPIFKQQRVGKNQHLFTLIKFRTMSLESQSVATHLANKDLVTRFGKFLRKSKLDELPQLFNVLKGEMSLVGPRPCLPSQEELIRVREEKGVFTVLPGITGLAQINQIDMSTPIKLAQVDQTMISSLNIQSYFNYIFATAIGKGQGDKIKG